MKNLEQVTQESKLSKIGNIPKNEVSKYIEAIKDARICHQKDGNGLNFALRYVFALIGLRANNIPNEAEKAVLIDFIFSNYGNHTPAEIKLAFQMAIAGRLDVDARHFENFTPAYFSTIMNAYRSWVANENLKDRDNTPPEQILYNEEQLNDFHREWTEEFYQRLRKGYYFDKIPEYAKRILVIDKQIEHESQAGEYFSKCIKKGMENIYVKK